MTSPANENSLKTDQAVEIIDMKLQEAIVSIQSHANRIKNIIKNDPINNKADASWKITFEAKDMLQKDKTEKVQNDNVSIKNTSVKTIPLKKDHKPKLSPNRTIQIPNVGRPGPEICKSCNKHYGDIMLSWIGIVACHCMIRAKISFVNGRYQQSKEGFVHQFALSNFKDFFG